MSKVKNKNHGKYFLTIAFASVFSLLFVGYNNAYAHGPPPSGCYNLYDSVFTSIMVESQGITFDPVLTPGVVIPVQIGVGYKLNYTLHTSAASVGVKVNGITNPSVYGPNTEPGSTWFGTLDGGFPMNVCVGNVGPNQDIISPTYSLNYYFPDGSIRVSSWGTSVGGISNLPPGQTTYFYLYRSTPVASPPSDAPRSLSAYAVSSSQINLRWDAPIANFQQGSVVPGYKIERSIDSGATWSTLVEDTNSTTGVYYDAGLAHSTTYFYRVSKMTQGVSGSPSNWAGATTFNVVPSPPVKLTASATTDINGTGQINLDWTAPSDDGGTPITGYMIERSIDNGSTWSTIVPNTSSTSTTYSDTGLQPSTTYTYRVSAINDVGKSFPSNTASATTP